MISVKFLATYLPNHREFNVLVKFGKDKRIFEKMSISKFLRLARNKHKPLVIDGITISFTGGDGEKEIREYLAQVADAYLKSRSSLN